ncbi:MAG: hypothetical protein ACJ8C4_20365 [Gemmataceae bacterium]
MFNFFSRLIGSSKTSKKYVPSRSRLSLQSLEERKTPSASQSVLAGDNSTAVMRRGGGADDTANHNTNDVRGQNSGRGTDDAANHNANDDRGRRNGGRGADDIAATSATAARSRGADDAANHNAGDDRGRGGRR